MASSLQTHCSTRSNGAKRPRREHLGGRMKSTLFAALVASVALASGCAGNGESDGGNGADMSASYCNVGQSQCGGDCVDLTGDNRNCGTCGHACDPGWSCSKSTC